MSIRPRVSFSLPALLACACSFDATGLVTMGPPASSTTSDSEPDGSSSAPTEATANPTTTTSDDTLDVTSDAGSDVTTDPTTGPTTSPVTDTTTAGTDTTDTTGGMTCGNGMIEGSEQCDDGASNGPTMACTTNCVPNVCGDGGVGPGEGCDDGNIDDGDGCAADCKLEGCGDGKKMGMEECDDGNMVDTDACTNACLNAICGDGSIQAGTETCDDKNLVDTDACTNECLIADCGDGKIQEGVDECDDGNDNNDDFCSNLCKNNSVKRVFVSSLKYTGGFGGYGGADTKCTTLATGAGLSGKFLAWISNDADNTAPAVRFTKANVPYIKMDGERIADNWNDLVDGSLDSPIDVFENGLPADGEEQVWSNVDANGTEDNDDSSECSDWIVGGNNGSVGNWKQTDTRWSDLDANVPHSCNEERRIYCFEQ